MTIIPQSTLTRSQSTTTPWKEYEDGGQLYRIRAILRFDDQCGNGHNALSVTGQTQMRHGGGWIDDSCGCIHTEIARHLPEYREAVLFHLCSTDGPMHYIANTVYHADEHGPNAAWIYYKQGNDPIGLMGERETSVYTLNADTARAAESTPGYQVVWDEKTAKKRNLGHARSCAIWPDATDADLMQGKEKLRAVLDARLPALMERFYALVTSLGFKW